MQAYANINVLVVATENITTEWYRGECCLAGLMPKSGARVDCSSCACNPTAHQAKLHLRD